MVAALCEYIIKLEGDASDTPGNDTVYHPHDRPHHTNAISRSEWDSYNSIRQGQGQGYAYTNTPYAHQPPPPDQNLRMHGSPPDRESRESVRYHRMPNVNALDEI